jgi:BirA family biotin operon repressor/biotin-[acetyl-CoA-carboxylase] ligase
MSAHSTFSDGIQRITSLLTSWDLHALVEHVSVIDSSNTELMRRARQGDSRTCLLLADQQTAGRGRLGRQWQGRSGDALTFSLGLSMSPTDWSGLSLAVGCCLADALDPMHDKGIGLKWPNDLLLGQSPHPRKLGGILIETVVRQGPPEASRYVVIGIGLNLSVPPAGEYRSTPAGLREVSGKQLTTFDVLQIVLPGLLEGLKHFERAGFAVFQQAFERRDVLPGQTLQLSDGTHGISLGVNTQGVLQLQTEQGLIQVGSDEVSVLPMEAA